MNYPRSARVAELIQAELADLLMREVKDPRVESIVITRVEVSPDLRQATIHFSRYGEGRGGEEEVAEGREGLERAGSFLQMKLGERLALKRVPHLRFVVDRGMAHSEHIERLIYKLRRERPEKRSP